MCLVLFSYLPDSSRILEIWEKPEILSYFDVIIMQKFTEITRYESASFLMRWFWLMLNDDFAIDLLINWF